MCFQKLVRVYMCLVLQAAADILHWGCYYVRVASFRSLVWYSLAEFVVPRWVNVLWCVTFVEFDSFVAGGVLFVMNAVVLVFVSFKLVEILLACLSFLRREFRTDLEVWALLLVYLMHCLTGGPLVVGLVVDDFAMSLGFPRVRRVLWADIGFLDLGVHDLLARLEVVAWLTTAHSTLTFGDFCGGFARFCIICLLVGLIVEPCLTTLGFAAIVGHLMIVWVGGLRVLVIDCFVFVCCDVMDLVGLFCNRIQLFGFLKVWVWCYGETLLKAAAAPAPISERILGYCCGLDSCLVLAGVFCVKRAELGLIRGLAT
eukprot:gene2780-1765_t